jgi:hypothetical protein
MVLLISRGFGKVPPSTLCILGRSPKLKPGKNEEKENDI